MPSVYLTHVVAEEYPDSKGPGQHEYLNRIHARAITGTSAQPLSSTDREIPGILAAISEDIFPCCGVVKEETTFRMVVLPVLLLNVLSLYNVYNKNAYRSKGSTELIRHYIPAKLPKDNCLHQ